MGPAGKRGLEGSFDALAQCELAHGGGEGSFDSLADRELAQDRARRAHVGERFAL